MSDITICLTAATDVGVYRKNNERDYNAERRTNEYNISKGRPPKDWFIYELESYEPFEVEYSKDII